MYLYYPEFRIYDYLHNKVIMHMRVMECIRKNPVCEKLKNPYYMSAAGIRLHSRSRDINIYYAIKDNHSFPSGTYKKQRHTFWSGHIFW